MVFAVGLSTQVNLAAVSQFLCPAPSYYHTGNDAKIQFGKPQNLNLQMAALPAAAAAGGADHQKEA